MIKELNLPEYVNVRGQVHDELVLEVPEGKIEEVVKMVNDQLHHKCKKLQEVCNLNTQNQICLTAISQGHHVYASYCTWLEENWPEEKEINFSSFDLIKRLYLANL